MSSLLPVTIATTPLDEAGMEAFYAFPVNPRRPWVRVTFVSGLDGAASVDGGSRGLSSPTDRDVLLLIRDLSDVVLVGLGTVVAEGYRPLRPTRRRAQRRRRAGLSGLPPVAVVTNSCAPASPAPLLTTPGTIVITCESAPVERRDAIVDAGATVIIAGDERVDPATAIAELGARGLRRIACEGGPGLFGSLIEQDLVDELCLTVAPLLTSGGQGRIATGPATPPRRMTLAGAALGADQPHLFLRYVRADITGDG